MNIEDLNLVIVTRSIDGIKRGTVGEVFCCKEVYRVKFGKYETMPEKWLRYAIKIKRVKPYMRSEDAQKLFSVRTGRSDDKGGLSSSQSDRLQRASSLPLPMQKALATANASRNK